MKKFEVGKTYYGWNQKGEIRLMKVTAISTNGKAIKAIYHNNNETIMNIHDVNGEQWVEADKRYKVVVTADEYKPIREEKKEETKTQYTKKRSNITDLQKELGSLLLPN